MAAQHLSLAHHEPVALHLGAAVAEAELTAAGPMRQQAGHGMALSIRIHQLLPQQQQPAAFGIDRPPSSSMAGQGAKALAALAQLAGMQLGVAPWQHHRSALRRQRLIRQWCPVADLAAQMLQRLLQLRVAEMEGGIARHRHHRAMGWLLRPQSHQGMLCCFSAIAGQVRPEAFEIQPLRRQRRPLLAALRPIGQVLRWQQAQMPAGEF